MQQTQQEQAAAAKEFANLWTGRGDEKSDTQTFWISLLTNVYACENAETFITFEKRVQLGHTSFIDGYIPSTLVLIEQKSIDINLRTSAKQSDGSLLNPFEQAKRYADNMKFSERPRWIVTCNFKSFLVYDMENPKQEPEEILLENLEKEFYRLSFLVSAENIHLKREMELSIKAGEIVGLIYDGLLASYADAHAETLRALNILCVRLVFCLYAEDAGLFASKSQFHDWLEQFPPKQIRRALIDLFKVLDTPQENRDPYLDEDLARFPYVNGGLFSEEEIAIPQFDEDLRTLLLQKASEDFDWSDISPTIFGAVFESTLNPDTRRSGGMHYTSIENIHKVIDPLFMADLQNEFAEICRIKTESNRNEKLDALQNKIGSLKILDPACGSGNFLTESYLSLRKLENEIIKRRNKGDALLGFDEFVKVKINNFYGIEINDFAVSVAKTALWIAEEQMMEETSKIVDVQFDFLPLKTNACIVEGNALRLDWSTFRPTAIKPNAIYADKTNIYKIDADRDFSVCEPPPPKYGEVNIVTKEVEFKNVAELNDAAEMSVEFDYIIGNPPFVGYAYRTARQQEDLKIVSPSLGKNIDYVAGWYFKAAQLIAGTKTRCAFVSTNSITQGEQVASVFKPLFEDFGIQIDFAYRTFRWDSESTQKAHVHCVIIGFSCNGDNNNPQIAQMNTDKDNYDNKNLRANLFDESATSADKKIIFDEDGNPHEAKMINSYLLDAPNVFIDKRIKPICPVVEIIRGSSPNDDGNLLLTYEEYCEYIKKEPQGEKFIRPFMMGKDFIQRKPRYCFWLVDANPAEIKKCPILLKRIAAVKIFRKASKRKKTLQLSSTPTLFEDMRISETKYIAIPKVSSENRSYIPIDYLESEVIPGDKIFFMKNATLYHFAVLTSSIHNAWMRAVCGRLEMRYSYSNTIVYNNFVWCEPTTGQKAKIEKTAQAILDTRAKYPDASLADLYDELSMPPDLRKAHQANDKAVLATYGFSEKMSEAEIVAALFGMYEKLVEVK